MNEFISVEDALRAILDRTTVLGSQTVELKHALGRTLAKPYVATIDAPPFTNSAMDGVAFRYEDLATRDSLRIIGTVAAGDDPSGLAVGLGEAVRIMTGAPLPDTLDSVVMREEVDGVDDVRFTGDVTKGMNVRRQGEYVTQGVTTLAAGTVVDPGVVSLLATYGFSEVDVIRVPIVSIITTGSELVPISQTPGPGQIRNSNMWMLAALCRASGVRAVTYDIVRDNADAVRTAFDIAIEASDVVVSVGGVSMGEFDFVRPTIESLAGEASFWKVKMKPGKPLTHGKAGDVHLVGLPGNPMSCFVTFQMFVAPLLRKLTGVAPDSEIVTVKNAVDLRSTPKRREYVTGRVDAGVFYRIGEQSSGDVSAMAGCNALGVIDEGVSAIPAGDPIDVVRL